MDTRKEPPANAGYAHQSKPVSRTSVVGVVFLPGNDLDNLEHRDLAEFGMGD